MLDIVKHITINDKEFPLSFSFNVMELIQEKYGTMKEWGETLQPTEKVIDQETGQEVVKALEPKIKDIIWTFKEFINEGIDIENEEKGEKRPFVTEKQVGRLISSTGMSKVTKVMQSLTVKSTKTDDIKNEQTTQDVKETTIQNQTL